MATILDVAKRAGVSIATVSRYFNQGYVSRESERKISRAVKELDYKINPIAQALMKKSSKMTGLILPSITNPFFPELAKAVEYEIHQGGDIVYAIGNGGQTCDVGSPHPGAEAGPKGWSVRPLKRLVSWVQNVVRQFGPSPL